MPGAWYHPYHSEAAFIRLGSTRSTRGQSHFFQSILSLPPSLRRLPPPIVNQYVKPIHLNYDDDYARGPRYMWMEPDTVPPPPRKLVENTTPPLPPMVCSVPDDNVKPAKGGKRVDALARTATNPRNYYALLEARMASANSNPVPIARSFIRAPYRVSKRVAPAPAQSTTERTRYCANRVIAALSLPVSDMRTTLSDLTLNKGESS